MYYGIDKTCHRYTTVAIAKTDLIIFYMFRDIPGMRRGIKYGINFLYVRLYVHHQHLAFSCQQRISSVLLEHLERAGGPPHSAQLVTTTLTWHVRQACDIPTCHCAGHAQHVPARIYCNAHSRITLCDAHWAWDIGACYLLRCKLLRSCTT